MKTLTTILISLFLFITGFSQEETIKLTFDRSIVKQVVLEEGFELFLDSADFIMFSGTSHSTCYYFDKNNECYMQVSIYGYDYYSEVIKDLNDNLMPRAVGHWVLYLPVDKRTYHYFVKQFETFFSVTIN